MSTNAEQAAKLPPRTQWVRYWMEIDRHELHAQAEKVSQGVELEYRQVPEAGLAMLRLRDSVKGQPFNLGEIPVSSSWVSLRYADNTVIEGAAVVMADDQKLAITLAIMDAATSAKAPGYETCEALLYIGEKKFREKQQIRHAMLNRTRVDFALLNQES